MNCLQLGGMINPAQITRAGPTRPLSFFVDFILRQMLETCVSMTFPDFQRLMEWCQSYFAKMSLKAYMGVYGYHTTHGYLIMCQIYYIQHVNAIFSAKPIWPDMTSDTLYVKSLPAP